MDPITVVIITLLVLATGGATGKAAVEWRRAHQRQLLAQSVHQRRPIDGQMLGLFDVFWDLGVSDFALEIMGHQGLLPDDAAQVDRALTTLEALIREHGSYGEYIADSLEAIQEFYEEHRRAGNRRHLPTLEMRVQKLLPLPEPASPTAATGALVDYRSSALLERSLDERQQLRAQHWHAPPGSYMPGANMPGAPVPGAPVPGLWPMGGIPNTGPPGGPQAVVDLDQIVNLDVNRVLEALFAGRFSDQVNRWWRTRRLRTLKNELDARLSALYGYYANLFGSMPALYDHLYDAQRRWQHEAARIGHLRQQAPWHARPWAPIADILVDEAHSLATRLATQAYQNVYSTIESIHSYARAGNTAMAGYLLYLNQHAFFAGRGPEYATYTRQIEYATHRVQEELYKLRREGML